MVSYEDARHMIEQCHAMNEIRNEMYDELNQICDAFRVCNFGVLMGRFIDDWDFNEMLPIWLTASKYVAKMYREVLKTRAPKDD